MKRSTCPTARSGTQSGLTTRRRTIVRRPLIVFHGGYDSIVEELYFFLAAAANSRGLLSPDVRRSWPG